MRNRVISLKTCLLLCLICIISTVTVMGSPTMKQIVAYLNYGVNVVVDGEIKELYDANGNRVYPISYGGSTYLPVRGLSEVLNIPVTWDSNLGSVVIDTKNKLNSKIDLLLEIEKNTNLNNILTTEQEKTIILKENENKLFNNGLYCKTLLNQDFQLKDYIGIPMPKNISKITFYGYSEALSSINVFNQQGKLLKTFYVNPNSLTFCELEIDTSKNTEIFMVGLCQDEKAVNKFIKILNIFGY